jgi:hypothetical protein
MKARLTRLAAATLVLLLGGSAHGATLSTPILYSSTGECIECRALNLGTATLSLTMELIRFDGTILGGPTTFNLAPGTDGPANAQGSCVNGLRAYCRFTFGVPKSKVRAAGYVFNGSEVSEIVPAY